MIEPNDDENILQLLSAFVDGELDAPQTLRVLDYLIEHPEELEWIRDQQRLTLAAHSVLDRAVKAPTSLRDSVVALPPRTHRFGAWRIWSFAIAAMILILIGTMIARETWRRANSPQHAGAAVIPASIVAHASQVHADCSRLAAGLHSAGYPENQGELASDVKRDLNSDRPYPNLSSIGFRYIGAGPCGDPLPNTIHLLYKSAAPGLQKSVSIFVQLNAGQFALEPGKIYSVSVAQSPFPMLAWRTEHVVYFLLADDENTEQSALSLIRGQ